MCRTGEGAGSSAGADKGPDRRQSNHERTDDQAGRRRPANTDSDGDSPVHTAADTPSKNAATSDTHCNFMRQRGGTSQGSSRVEEERHETSRGSHNRGTIRRKCRKQLTPRNSAAPPEKQHQLQAVAPAIINLIPLLAISEQDIVNSG